MTNTILQQPYRILAIAPTTRGFGFAVLEGVESLVDWGVRRIEGDNKNSQALTKVKALITQCQPGLVVLQDASAKNSRRAPRIKLLTKRIIALAKSHKIRVKLCSFEKTRQIFFADGKGTKHVLAEILVNRFPGELTAFLPPKRRAWASEDSHMGIFDAVALAVAFRLQQTKPGQNRNDC